MNKNFDDYLKFISDGKKKKIGQNFTLSEIAFSKTAIDKRIANIPNEQQINNGKKLILNGLQPTRTHFNSIMDVHCIYRNLGVNKLVGGSLHPLSQHCEALAADITMRNVSLISIVEFMCHNCQFDQIILEPNWVHYSYVEGHNRKQVLKKVGEKYVNY